MKYNEWKVRPVVIATAKRKELKYQVYRAEIGGEFTDKEEAEFGKE